MYYSYIMQPEPSIISSSQGAVIDERDNNEMWECLTR